MDHTFIEVDGVFYNLEHIIRAIPNAQAGFCDLYLTDGSCVKIEDFEWERICNRSDTEVIKVDAYKRKQPKGKPSLQIEDTPSLQDDEDSGWA